MVDKDDNDSSQMVRLRAAQGGLHPTMERCALYPSACQDTVAAEGELLESGAIAFTGNGQSVGQPLVRFLYGSERKVC